MVYVTLAVLLSCLGSVVYVTLAVLAIMFRLCCLCDSSRFGYHVLDSVVYVTLDRFGYHV